jgi:hypothetical protein
VRTLSLYKWIKQVGVPVGCPQCLARANRYRNSMSRNDPKLETLHLNICEDTVPPRPQGAPRDTSSRKETENRRWRSWSLLLFVLCTFGRCFICDIKLPPEKEIEKIWLKRTAFPHNCPAQRVILSTPTGSEVASTVHQQQATTPKSNHGVSLSRLDLRTSRENRLDEGKTSLTFKSSSV